jgi:hypothetical protein
MKYSFIRRLGMKEYDRAAQAALLTLTSRWEDGGCRLTAPAVRLALALAPGPPCPPPAYLQLA